MRAGRLDSSDERGKDEEGLQLDTMEVTIVIALAALLVLFVGIPLAAWWWLGDVLREKIRKSELKRCPRAPGCVTSNKRGERECL